MTTVIPIAVSLFAPCYTHSYDMSIVFCVYRVKLCSCFAYMVYIPWKLVGVSSIHVWARKGGKVRAPGSQEVPDLELAYIRVVLLTTLKSLVVDAV